MARGGARPNSGPKPEHPKSENLNTRVTAPDALTLRQYNQAAAVAYLAAGLRLGSGNLPELTDPERVLLADVLPGTPDLLALRHLEDDLADLVTDDGDELPERDSLISKLRPLGDWERLVLALTRGAGQDSARSGRWPCIIEASDGTFGGFCVDLPAHVGSLPTREQVTASLERGIARALEGE